MSSKKTTLIDVGAVAGVSPATASMILSERAGVSFTAETIRKVWAAAEELNYKIPALKNNAAKLFLRKTIFIICPNVLNSYYAMMVQSIEQAARQKNYETIIYTTYRDLEKEISVLQMASKANFAGIVFAMVPQSIEIIEHVNRTTPVVVIGDRNNNLNLDTVELNNYAAGSLIASHMLELGHKHIAYISTTLNASNSARVHRLEGIKDIFQKECPEGSVLVKSRDIDPETELGNFFIEHDVGYTLTKKCLNDKKITAFVAVNDMVGYGVLDAIRESGFNVPQDYSVCGFDNIFPSQFAGVSLTTVEHYIAEKGHNAFDILYNKINGISSRHNITRVEYKHRLVVRNSTAVPRQVL